MTGVGGAVLGQFLLYNATARKTRRPRTRLFVARSPAPGCNFFFFLVSSTIKTAFVHTAPPQRIAVIFPSIEDIVSRQRRALCRRLYTYMFQATCII